MNAKLQVSLLSSHSVSAKETSFVLLGNENAMHSSLRRTYDFLNIPRTSALEPEEVRSDATVESAVAIKTLYPRYPLCVAGTAQGLLRARGAIILKDLSSFPPR